MNAGVAIKVYSTAQGLVLVGAGKQVLCRGESWDDLLTRERLAPYLQQLLDSLPPYADFAAEAAVSLRPPLQSQELWASGVTYLRSKTERQQESQAAGGADFYQRVYEAERPELFFKANPLRVVGHGGQVRIRADSRWNVPEPELTLVLNRRGAIVGYTIGNDMSSRSIEGENPLYLPQAKTYDGCAALGPCVLVSEAAFPRAAAISLCIERQGRCVFSGEIAVSAITRRFEDLAAFLFRECSFPQGVLLMTGTGIVPPADFTLQRGDSVTIGIDGIGQLRNDVA